MEGKLAGALGRLRALPTPIRARVTPPSAAEEAARLVEELYAAVRVRCAEGTAGRGERDAQVLPRAEKLIEQAAQLVGQRDLVLGARAVDEDTIFGPLSPTPWLVRELQWCPGRPSMLLGFGASGKTLAAQSAALSLVTGRPIWGWFRPQKRCARVIHLDLEQGERATRKRYQRIAVGLGVSDEERVEMKGRLRLVPFPRVYLNSQGAADAYKRAVEGYDLCILDALRGATPGIDENDSKIRECIDVLAPISETTGCTLLLIHHAGKGFGPDRDTREMGRGSSAIFDACGATLAIAAEQSDDGAEVHRRVQMTKPAAEAEGVRVEPFYLAIEDVSVGEDRFAGVRVAYRTVEQTKGPALMPGDKFATLKAKVLAYVQAETRAGRAVPGKAALAAALDARRPDVIAAVEALLAEGRVEDRPERHGRASWKPRLWAVGGTPQAGNANVCSRCAGSGHLAAYDHREGGVCFRCGGSGVIHP